MDTLRGCIIGTLLALAIWIVILGLIVWVAQSSGVL